MASQSHKRKLKASNKAEEEKIADQLAAQLNETAAGTPAKKPRLAPKKEVAAKKEVANVKETPVAPKSVKAKEIKMKEAPKVKEIEPKAEVKPAPAEEEIPVKIKPPKNAQRWPKEHDEFMLKTFAAAGSTKPVWKDIHKAFQDAFPDAPKSINALQKRWHQQGLKDENIDLTIDEKRAFVQAVDEQARMDKYAIITARFNELMRQWDGKGAKSLNKAAAVKIYNTLKNGRFIDAKGDIIELGERVDTSKDEKEDSGTGTDTK